MVRADANFLLPGEEGGPKGQMRGTLSTLATPAADGARPKRCPSPGRCATTLSARERVDLVLP
jgi:hypothetical protein